MVGDWVDLRLLVLNRGDHSQYVDIRRAMRANDIHIATLCEMHSVQRILTDLEDDGYRVWRGDRKDSESTPVVWDPKVFRAPRVELKSYPLLPAKTRGGIYNMAKSLNIAKGEFLPAHRSLAVGSLHNIQTQAVGQRRVAARDYVENALGHVRARQTALILAGDCNARPEGPSLAPLRHAPGWRCDQAVLRPLNTGPHRSPIDMAWVRERKESPGVIRIQRHFTIHVRGTDHKGLVVVLGMRRRAA